MAMADLVAAMPGDRSLLIVEDDKSFLQRLAAPWRAAALP